MTIATLSERRQRALALMLVAACAALLAACGSPTGAPTNTSASTPDATANAAATTIALALTPATMTPTTTPAAAPTVAPIAVPTSIATLTTTVAPTVAPSETPTPAPVPPRIDLDVLEQTLVGEIPLQGTGEPNSTVFVYLDGAIAATADVGAGGAWAVLLVPVEAGQHVLTVAASDAANAERSAPVRVVVQARLASTPTNSPTLMPSPTTPPTSTYTPTSTETPTATQIFTPTRRPTSTPTATKPPTLTPTRTPDLEATAAAAVIATAHAQPPTPASRAGDSDTWIEPVTGMAFVRVPAGEFTMGSADAQVDAALELCNATWGNCDRMQFEGETPQHLVYLDDYWIGQTEVTNAQFRQFVEGGGYGDQSLWTEDGWQWRMRENVTRPYLWDDPAWNQPNHPVVGVRWYEAVAYTNWLTQETGRQFRLPSEAEWEKAARGSDGRTYPWGDEVPSADHANWNGQGSTAPVSSYPHDSSPYGVLDMAGNASEWTASSVRDYPYIPGDGRENLAGSEFRIFRGGYYNSLALPLRSASRSSLGPNLSVYNIGLRVVAPGP